ncbi:MAG: MASE1 domain-containing protein [Chloroflexi bacterium]|nr:MASE1 domain-containing protein [Chloroflexota bacterium]
MIDEVLHVDDDVPFIRARSNGKVALLRYIQTLFQLQDEDMKLKFAWYPSRSTQGYFSSAGEILALCAIYFGTARLGLSLDAVSGFATLVWLPSGIAVAALFLFGYRLWPGILMGAFLVNLSNGAPFFVAAGIGIGNTLEALVCNSLLKHYRVSHALDHLRDVLFLVLLAIPLGTFISATVGVSSLLLGKVIAFSSFSETWRAWWIGDMISILIVTSFLLTWSTWRYEKTSVKRMAEMGSLTVFVLATGLIVFLGLHHADQGSSSLTYVVFPPLIWAALRFGPRGALSAILALSILAIIGTFQGFSPFSTGRPSESLIFLQSFMGIIAVTTMILAAVMAERRALEQRKDAFISMVSHELKTPLTILQGYGELLSMKFAQQGNQEALHHLTKMATQIEKLSELIANLLDISKIQAGKIALVEEVVDVDLLVQEVVENLQQTTCDHQISVEGRAQREIMGDKERLGQVLTNLIANAIKYSPRQERIIVHLMHTPETLIVSVQDFGIGISKAHQKKVFERFYRVDSDKDRTYPGLGIGLYIAYQIIERHGGKMWVESMEGQGSTFSFSLPLAAEA